MLLPLFLATVTATVATAATPTKPTYDPGDGWTLVWSDEFDSTTTTTLDPANWAFEIGTGSSGWGNNELEYYTSSSTNANVTDGSLYITALANDQGHAYTSARVKTEGLQQFEFGKVVASMQLPYGVGIWPAFWMLGSNINNVSWPTCGEIDIMELNGAQAATTDFTVHWNTAVYPALSQADYGLSATLPSGIFNDNFHFFEVEWNENVIIGRLDGVEMVCASFAFF